MHRLSPILLLALAAGLTACGRSPAAESRGLVLLPDEGPLARGVEKRDPRPYFHDFGRVSDGDTVSHAFRLRNTDPRAVAITRVTPGCGCSVAALRTVRADGSVIKGEPITSRAPRLLTVAPGELCEIEVKIATRDIGTKNSDKLITMGVATDSPNGYFLSLEVHLFVEQPFAVVPGAIALGRIPESGGGAGQVDIVQAGPFHHQLGELVEVPAGVHARLTSEIRNGLPVWTLHAGFEPPLARGPRTAVLRIASEEGPGVPGRVVEVPLTAQVVGDLGAEPERVVFAAGRDERRSASCELFSRLAGQRLRVSGVAVPAALQERLVARYEPLEPDDDGASLRWRLTLETVPPLGDGEMLHGALLVRLDDPQHPSWELDFVVHLK